MPLGAPAVEPRRVEAAAGPVDRRVVAVHGGGHGAAGRGRARRPGRRRCRSRYGAVHRRQEQAVHLRVPDRVGDLPGLPGDVAAPDRVPLRPECPRPRRRSACRRALTTMENGMESSRVAMPPSNSGCGRRWPPRGSRAPGPPGRRRARTARRAPAPSLVAGPRTRKFRAASPQYRRSQSMFASNPPLAETTALARDPAGTLGRAHDDRGAGAPRSRVPLEPLGRTPSYLTVIPARCAVR